MTTDDAIEKVCELAREKININAIRQAKQRHGAVLAWKNTDYLPILFQTPTPEIDNLPSFDWKEQWYNPAKSFVEQMKGVVTSAASHSDAIPSLRSDTGIINAPSIFGIEFDVPTHTKPRTTKHLAKEQLQDFYVPNDISQLGIVPRIIEHMEHHLGTLRMHGLADRVSVHHCDTQGAFDIAAQARGHDIFTDFYDDPAFVHHLMAESTKAYVALSRLCKRISGEPDNAGNADGYWMNQGGVRSCDDSGILLSIDIFEEFVLPYLTKGFEPFGGGWIHYCGGVPEGGRPEGIHLHDAYCKIPYLKGLNFTTGHDLAAEIRKLMEHKVVFIGDIPRQKDEDLQTYFRRMLELCPDRKGVLLSVDVRNGESKHAMETWHRLQDEVFD